MLGATQLVRLILRRDRLRLTIWVLAITAVTLVSGRGMVSTFGTQRSIDAYASSIEGSAAAIAMTGPPIGLRTLAGVVINKVAAVALIGICLMVVFEVVRHTRTEEEEGRTELLRSTVVGRHAGVAAVLAVTCAASAMVGIGVAIALLASTVPASAAWVFGAGAAGLGIAFAAITLVLAQLFSHGRTTLGAALGLLGVSYVVRAVGDVQHSWLVWLSPIGWAQATHPLGGNRWWPVLVCLVAAGVLTAVGVALEARRDVGAGLVSERPGRANASGSLSGPVGLTWRLQRGSIIGWGCGLLLLAAAMGSLSKQMNRMARDNPTLERYLHATGQGGIVDSFFATMLLILALLTALFAVSSTLRCRAEEAAGRLEPLLATGLSRTRWYVASLLVTVLAATGLLLVAGLGLGIAYGLTISDGTQPLRLALLELVFLPAVLVLAAVAAVLTGWLPNWARAAWAFAAFCLVLGWLGGLLDAPRWVEKISPFTSTPSVPVESAGSVSLIVIGALAVLLLAAGLVGLRSRDIQPG